MPKILGRLFATGQPETRRREHRRRRLARRLTQAIDEAMSNGQRTRAALLADRATGLSPGHPRLAECLARFRLAQGRPETALRIIEGCGQPPASLRMLRAVCLILVGRRADAHADLLRWSERASAPLDARLLLGFLEWQLGDTPAALRAWRRNLRHLDDPRTIMALLLAAVQRDRPEQAELWARRLGTAGTAGPGPEADLVLASLGLPRRRGACEFGPEQANALAIELMTAQRAIGPLVEAQRLAPHPPTARLVRDAIIEALDELGDRAAACEALTRLSLVLDEPDRAALWARRGLEANPMSATLALLVADLTAPAQPPAGREQAA